MLNKTTEFELKGETRTAEFGYIPLEEEKKLKMSKFYKEVIQMASDA